MRTGLTKQEKTTDIWFDEKDPLIHIRTHNTDLKKRLLAYDTIRGLQKMRSGLDAAISGLERALEKFDA